jgi:hypothetical protein
MRQRCGLPHRCHPACKMGFINLVSEDRASHRGIEPISGQLPHIALLFAVWKKLKRPQKSSKVLDRASHRRIEPISGQLPHIALLFAVWKKIALRASFSSA